MKIARSLFVLLLLTFAVRAQQQTPHIAYVYPAGGRLGTTFQIVVGGQFLLSVTNAFFDCDDIKATVIDRTRPMNQKEFNDLRDRLQALQQKFQSSHRRNVGTNVWTEVDAKEREEIRAKILKNPPNRKANPTMLDTVIVQLSIGTNTSSREHEIRLASSNALSNPLKFVIGNLPEVSKLAAKPANPDLDRFLERIGRKPTPPGTPKYENHVSLPVTINGQIMPGEVDRYHFTAMGGQQLVIAASARALIPYLADAVPGWFEATLTIYDAKGKQLAEAERFRFKPDPLIHFEVPHDGEYIVEIHDSIYRGREDFVYRLTIGELPYVTDIFPLGGTAGETTSIALTGWNLKRSSIQHENLRAQFGTTFLSGDSLNAVPFAVDDLPECLAQESNHSIQNAQPVSLPVIINGHVNRAGESEVFKFEGRKDQQIVAEVVARRLDSPLDSFLRLTDVAGKQLAFNDDFDDKASGLETHHADSCLTATLPVDGFYFVHLNDTQGKGGPEFAYRLRISEPRPDFALRIVPSSLNVRSGLSVPLTAYAIRKDGFTNAIDLHLTDAATGFFLSGNRIPENQDKVQFTLKAPLQNPGKLLNLELEGTATLNGQTITHRAAPAENMEQAFAYWHLVPSRELAVAVTPNPRPFAASAIRILSATPIKIPLGRAGRIRIATPSPAFADRFKLELNAAPDGLSLSEITPVENGIELVITADRGKAKVGAAGNLIVNVTPKFLNLAPNQKKLSADPSHRPAAPVLPAIPFKIVAD